MAIIQFLRRHCSTPTPPAAMATLKSLFAKTDPETICAALDGVLCPGCSTPHAPLAENKRFLFESHAMSGLSKFIPTTVPEGFTFVSCLTREELGVLCMRWIRTQGTNKAFPMQPLITLVCRLIELDCYPLILTKRAISSLALMVFHELANRLGDPSCFDGQFRYTQIRDNVMTAGFFNARYERLIVAIRTSELDPSRCEQEMSLSSFAVVCWNRSRADPEGRKWANGDTTTVPSPRLKTALLDEVNHPDVCAIRAAFGECKQKGFRGLFTTIDRVCREILEGDHKAAVVFSAPTSAPCGMPPPLHKPLFPTSTPGIALIPEGGLCDYSVYHHPRAPTRVPAFPPLPPPPPPPSSQLWVGGEEDFNPLMALFDAAVEPSRPCDRLEDGEAVDDFQVLSRDHHLAGPHPSPPRAQDSASVMLGAGCDVGLLPDHDLYIEPGWFEALLEDELLLQDRNNTRAMALADACAVASETKIPDPEARPPRSETSGPTPSSGDDTVPFATTCKRPRHCWDGPSKRVRLEPACAFV